MFSDFVRVGEPQDPLGFWSSIKKSIPRLIELSIIPALSDSTLGRTGGLLKSSALARIPDAESGSLDEHGSEMIRHAMRAASIRRIAVQGLACMGGGVVVCNIVTIPGSFLVLSFAGVGGFEFQLAGHGGGDFLFAS